MSRITVDGVGRKGFLPDPTGHDVPPEAWTSVRNIRFKNGDAYRVPGTAQVWGDLGTTAKYLLQVFDGATRYWVYAGDTKIYATDGVNHTNISKTAGAFDYSAAGYNWSGGVFHEVPFLNNGGDVPQVWNPVSPLSFVTDMPDWPATWRVKVMRPFKNFLVGLQHKIGTDPFQPQTLIWSHPADPGTMPASWNYTDPTRDAGRTSLAETPGALIDCLALGEHNIIYKDDSCYRMSFVGGSYVFDFKKISDKYGLLCQGALTSFEMERGFHFVVGKSDMYLTDGFAIVPLGQNECKEWFYKNISREYVDRVRVRTYLRHSEIWVGFPSEGAEWINTALIYNYKDRTWTLRDLPNISDFQLGFIPPDFIATWDNQQGGWNLDNETWEDDTSTWEENQQLAWSEMLRTWEEVAGDTNTDHLVAVGGDVAAAYVFEGAHMYLSQEYTSVLERQGISIIGYDREGRPITDFKNHKLCTELWPKIEGSDPVDIYVGGQDRKNGPIHWEGPFRFDPRYDVKVDCTASGILLCVRFVRRQPGSFRLSGYVMDVQLSGSY